MVALTKSINQCFSFRVSSLSEGIAKKNFFCQKECGKMTLVFLKFRTHLLHSFCYQTTTGKKGTQINPRMMFVHEPSQFGQEIEKERKKCSVFLFEMVLLGFQPKPSQ